MFFWCCLWASHVSIQNIQFSHVVPGKHMLSLKAKNITGKKLLTIGEANGQYADWFFTAKKFVLDTKRQSAVTSALVMDCQNPHVLIHAPSGILDLQNYNAIVQKARLTHVNMVFTCPKARYDHNSQIVTCWSGRMKLD